MMYNPNLRVDSISFSKGSEVAITIDKMTRGITKQAIQTLLDHKIARFATLFENFFIFRLKQLSCNKLFLHYKMMSNTYCFKPYSSTTKQIIASV